MQIRHIIPNTNAVYLANHMMLDSESNMPLYSLIYIWEHGVEQNEVNKNYENK